MHCAFIGIGKLGRPVAEVMSQYHTVVGYDLAPVESDVFPVVDSLEKALEGAEIVFIAVPTPHDPAYEGIAPTSHLPSKDFDYSAVEDVLTKIHDLLEPNAIVVLISTCLPGTTRERFEKLLPLDIEFIYNPYFIAMGTVKEDFCNPEFVLVGTRTGEPNWATEKLWNFYKPMLNERAHMRITTWTEAEAAKVFYNVMISTKLAIVNMIQDVAERIGDMNVDKVTEVLSDSNKRIFNPHAYMKAGMGDAGSCHPRDLVALSSISARYGMSYDLFSSVAKVREEQAKNLAYKCYLHSVFSPIVSVIVGKRLTILGKAYKPGTSLVIGSYSLLVAHYAREFGMDVDFDDPLTGDVASGDEPRVYLLAHPNRTDYPFIRGSTIIDPWRSCPDVEGCIVVHYGNTRGVLK